MRVITVPRSRRGPLPRPGGHRGRQDAQPRGGERAGARGGPLVLPPRPGQALAQLRRIRLAKDRDQVRADQYTWYTLLIYYIIYSWGKQLIMFAMQTASCLCAGCSAMLCYSLHHDISTFYLLFLPTLYILHLHDINISTRMCQVPAHLADTVALQQLGSRPPAPGPEPQ